MYNNGYWSVYLFIDLWPVVCAVSDLMLYEKNFHNVLLSATMTLSHWVYSTYTHTQSQQLLIIIIIIIVLCRNKNEIWDDYYMLF